MRLAELFVSITGDAKPLSATLGGVRRSLTGLVGVGASTGRGIAGGIASGLGGLARLGGLAALGGAGAGAAIGVGLYRAVSAASDLAETVSKVGEVFGASAGVVTGFADRMAADFGLVKTEVLDAASMFGLIATGMGQTKAEAAALGVKFAGLAADASSFYNVPVADALEKIRAGLTGESEPLKAFGVIMDEAAVKAQAAAMGFKLVGGELSNQAKLAARAAIIQRGLAAATGDLAKTADGFANRGRKLSGDFKNAMAAVGDAVMPAAKAILGGLSGALEKVRAYFERNRETVQGWATRIGGFIGGAFERIGGKVAMATGWLERNGATIAEWASGARDWIVRYEQAVWGLARALFGLVDGEAVVGGLGDVFTRVGDAIVGAVDGAAYAVRNWRDLTEIACLRVEAAILGIPKAMQEAVGAGIDWVAASWQGMLFGLEVQVFTFVQRMGGAFEKFFSSLAESLVRFLTDPTGGFRFDFSGMLAEFQQSIAQLPDLAAPYIDALEGRIAGIWDRIEGREGKAGGVAGMLGGAAAAGAAALRGQQFQAVLRPAPPGKPEQEKAPAAPEKAKKADMTHDLGEFARKLQEGALGTGDVAKQQLAEAKQANVIARAQLAALYKSGGMSAYGVAAP